MIHVTQHNASRRIPFPTFLTWEILSIASLKFRIIRIVRVLSQKYKFTPFICNNRNSIMSINELAFSFICAFSYDSISGYDDCFWLILVLVKANITTVLKKIKNKMNSVSFWRKNIIKKSNHSQSGLPWSNNNINYIGLKHMKALQVLQVHTRMIWCYK